MEGLEDLVKCGVDDFVVLFKLLGPSVCRFCREEAVVAEGDKWGRNGG